MQLLGSSYAPFPTNMIIFLLTLAPLFGMVYWMLNRIDVLEEKVANLEEKVANLEEEIYDLNK